MGWLRLVGSLKLKVSFAKEPYKRDDNLQKGPQILRSLLIVATPYQYMCVMSCISYLSSLSSQMFDETQSHVTWLTYMWNDLIIYGMTHPYVTWPIRMWHDPFIHDVPYSHLRSPPSQKFRRYLLVRELCQNEWDTSCNIWEMVGRVKINNLCHARRKSIHWWMSHVDNANGSLYAVE